MDNYPNSNDTDMPRPGATLYSMTLDEAGVLFREAGLPRNLRSLQRYCAGGRLDCIKEETINGLQYFVDPRSVDRAITQLAQLHGLSDDKRHTATGHDNVGPGPTEAAPVAPISEPIPDHGAVRPPTTLSEFAVPEMSENSPNDTVRLGRTASDVDTPDVADNSAQPAAADRDSRESESKGEGTAPPSNNYLQDYVDLLKSENSFLRQQVSVKDEQIADLLERDRESNILVQGLQKLLQPLLRAPGGSRRAEEPDGFNHNQT